MADGLRTFLLGQCVFDAFVRSIGVRQLLGLHSNADNVVVVWQLAQPLPLGDHDARFRDGFA